MPILVIKFGLVVDNYKHDRIGDLWKEAETEVLKIMPTFKSGDLFFQEEIIDGKLIYSFRYYTPKSNIKGENNDP